MSTSAKLIPADPAHFVPGQVYSYDTPYGMHYEGTFREYDEKNGRTYVILGDASYSNNRSNGTRGPTSQAGRAKHELSDVRHAKKIVTSSALPTHPNYRHDHPSAIPSLRTLARSQLSTKQEKDLKSDLLMHGPGKLFGTNSRRRRSRALHRTRHRASHRAMRRARHRTVKRSRK
jgi:hypothetical protein